MPGGGEVEAVLARARAGRPGDHYAVLGVDRDAGEAALKQAYRKLALKLHPDKCQAPGGDEAFKRVGQAFSCLSDPERRRYYDRFGREQGDVPTGPGARGGGAAHYQEFDAEELFNMFFNGMAPGMGGARVFRTNFGGGGFGGPRRAGQPPPQQQQPNFLSGIVQLLPLLLLMFFTFFGGGSQSYYSLQRTRNYPNRQTTARLDVPYYVNSYEFSRLRVYDQRNVESQVESETMERLKRSCSYENANQRWVRKQDRKTPSCDRFNQMRQKLREGNYAGF